MGRKAAIKRQGRLARSQPVLPAANTALEAMRRDLGARGRELPTSPPPGMRKMSDVLVEYARPALDMLEEDPEPPTLEAMQSSLKLALLVWNGVELGSEGEWVLDDVRASLGEDQLHDPLAAAVMGDLVERLIERKRTDYADDHRLMADLRVTSKARPGDFNVAVAHTWREPSTGSARPGLGSSVV